MMQVQSVPVRPQNPPTLAQQIKEKAEKYKFHPAVFRDGERLSLSRHAQYQGAKKQPTLGKRIKQTLSGLGNFALTTHYLDLKSHATHAPVYDQLSQFVALHKPSFENARQFVLDSARANNPHMPPAKQVAVAYESLLAYALEKGFSDPQFFGGQKDKMLHFLASGALSAQLYDPDMPRLIRGGVAENIAYGLGVLKEVLGPPFDTKDIAANDAGIASAQKEIALAEARAKVHRPAGAKIQFF